MVSLLQNARVVLTDSGGLQKEAYFFGRPCVTLREETEWTELVEAGVNWIAGTRSEAIVAAFQAACQAKPDFSSNLYGGGNAGRAIVEELRRL
jgi:UDP-GlcNAc3NAcA epimerase